MKKSECRIFSLLLMFVLVVSLVSVVGAQDIDTTTATGIALPDSSKDQILGDIDFDAGSGSVGNTPVDSFITDDAAADLMDADADDADAADTVTDGAGVKAVNNKVPSDATDSTGNAQADSSSSAVSAGSFSSTVLQGFNSFSSQAQPIAKLVVGDVAIPNSLKGKVQIGEMLLIKILLLIITLTVSVYAVGLTPALRENFLVKWLIAVVLSILVTRFLTSAELIMFLWLPQGVLGITLTALLPFIVFVFFIENFNSHIIRRVGWVLYATIFVFLAIYRWNELKVGGDGFNLAWIYLIVAGLSIVSLIFDKTLHSTILFGLIEGRGAQLAGADAAKLQEQIAEQRGIIASSTSTAAQVDAASKEIKSIEKKIKTLLKA